MRQAVQEAEANEEERRSREGASRRSCRTKEDLREEEVRTPLSHRKPTYACVKRALCSCSSHTTTPHTFSCLLLCLHTGAA